jgi:signal peptidase I
MTAEPSTKRETTLREYLDSLLVTVILALFGTTFLVQAFKIPSSSMEDTLLVGDHLLVNKFVFAGERQDGKGLLPYREVRRGDIVVFKYPFYPHQHFVKRVIGVPGDRLRIVNRQVYINGEPLPEPYKVHRSSLAHDFRDNFPLGEDHFAFEMMPEWGAKLSTMMQGDELVIPPGQYFVLGDNRDNSQDSRYWGLVARENIIGRPLLIYWSFANPAHSNPGGNTAVRGGSVPDNRRTHFFARARWKRLLRFVR